MIQREHLKLWSTRETSMTHIWKQWNIRGLPTESKPEKRNNLLPTLKCQSLVSTSRAEVLVHMGILLSLWPWNYFPPGGEGEGWEGGCHSIIQRSVTLSTLWRSALPDLVSPFGTEPFESVSYSTAKVRSAGDEFPDNPAQTFPLKAKTSDKRAGLQVRRWETDGDVPCSLERVPHFCMSAWGCWANSIVLSLRSGVSITVLMSEKFVGMFNGTFSWNNLGLGYFCLSLLCIAVRAGLLFCLWTRLGK